MITSAQVSAQLLQGQILCDNSLNLDIDGFGLKIHSNSPALIALLGEYFSHVQGQAQQYHCELIAIESENPDLAVDFADWPREAGKLGRKDSFIDLPGARLLRKVRTGMVFLQQPGQVIAAGPCLANDSQVINFINAQYMNWLQQQGWLICHAAGLCRGERGLAIAGFSGGGKSTLMLHMLEDAGLNFASNDRLFIKPDSRGVAMAGIPKMPRINPGTIVHSPRLQRLIPQAQRQRLLALPQGELWDLEDKYDAMIEPLYGPDRIQHRARLSALLILNWQRDSDTPFQLQQVDIHQRPELLQAVMKSPGPFYQQASGEFLSGQLKPTVEPYQQLLATTPVFEASGKVDFARLSQAFDQLTQADHR